MKTDMKNRSNRLYLPILCAALLSGAVARAQQRMAWDEAYRRADERIARLTLDEKIHFMRGYSSFLL